MHLSNRSFFREAHHGTLRGYLLAFLCFERRPYVDWGAPMASEPKPFIPEVAAHQRRWLKMVEFTNSSTRAAGIMLLAAIASVAIANSPLYDGFLEFWHQHITVGFGANVDMMSLAHIVNDILMAVFFLLVGLEIKYEMVAGDLRDVRQALLPIVAACGGVIAPIAIYLAWNAGTENASGWGVPTATDIAFALGILALLGSRVPNGLKVFLSTLAVADDIIAILVIAIFYGHSPNVGWLIAAAVVLLGLIFLNRKHVYSLVPYLLLGVVLWYCVFASGVHSTIAGVLLAFTIPVRTHVNVEGFHQWSARRLQRANEVLDANTPVIAQHEFLEIAHEVSRVSKAIVPPARRLEHSLNSWVYFLILPLFALANADVSLSGAVPTEVITNPVLWGTTLGLVLGKPVGIMIASIVVIKSKMAQLPVGVNWVHMLGASVLAGVGFTMAIFVANLAFTADATITVAKAGILLASVVAGVAGFLLLLVATRGKGQEPLNVAEAAYAEEEMDIVH